MGRISPSGNGAFVVESGRYATPVGILGSDAGFNIFVPLPGLELFRAGGNGRIVPEYVSERHRTPSMSIARPSCYAEPVANSLIIGLRYYAIVFSIAFALGVARTLVIAPAIGVTIAVLLEVPLLVVVSWLAARRQLKDCLLEPWQRAMAGGLAFALTIASEVILAQLLRGQTIADWAGDVARPLGLIGLAGQLVFGLIPIFAGQENPTPAAR